MIKNRYLCNEKLFEMKTSHIVVAAALLALAACGSRDANHALADAEASIAMGDTAMARLYCSELADTSASTMTPSQLCRQAIVYARLSELADSPADMGAAVECYERALQINVDSVNDFVSKLDIGDLAYVAVILNVARALREPEGAVSDYEQEMGGDLLDGVPGDVELATSEP